MQEDIIAHLKGVYAPNAIILHGSRARGKAREHSDWDFVFLYNSPGNTRNGRERYKGQHIEFSSHVLPVSDIEGEFFNKLQEAKVVYEENGEGTELLHRATAHYQKGVHWPEERIKEEELWMEGRIGGMMDNTENPVFFAKYLADLYQRIFNYWYWLLQHAHSQPFYAAAEEVHEKDPEYYELVAQLMHADTTPKEKVHIAQQIKDRLFS